MPLLSPVLLVLAHPRPDSLNHALAAEVRGTIASTGARVLVHDLYADCFDPLLPADQTIVSGSDADDRAAVEQDPLVRRYRADLASARAVVVVHPNWWGMPPAALTGWLDRVLAPGLAYRAAGPDERPTSLLSVRRLLIINTSDTPPAREREEIGDPLAQIWGNVVRPVLGQPDFERMVLPMASSVGDDQRRRWLAAAARAAAWVSGAAR